MKVDIHNTTKKYDVIYADPPWSYRDKACNGSAENQYKTMSLSDICNLPIKDISKKDCVLFLWTTYPMIAESLKLIESWGFTYKSIGFQWIKLNKKGIGYFLGLGRWARGNTKPCLIATKGKPKRQSASISQLIFAPLTRHSAKPPVVRDKIVQLMGEGKHIELFAREHCENWDCWGNEV